MSKEEIKKVWEFDPQIYPQKLWISVGAIKKGFCRF